MTSHATPAELLAALAKASTWEPEPFVSLTPEFMRATLASKPLLKDEPWEADRPWHLRVMYPRPWCVFTEDIDAACGPLYRMHMEQL